MPALGDAIATEALTTGAMTGFGFVNPLMIPIQIAMLIVLILIFAFAFGFSYIGSVVAAYLLQGAIIMFGFMFVGHKIASYVPI